MNTPRSSRFGPAAPSDRLVHLDIIRGFALLGVLLSNIEYWFRAPKGNQNLSYAVWPGFLDQATSWGIRALIEGKFIFLFSMLFGVGLAIQLERTEARGARFSAYASRRLFALAGIGLAHALLVWNGDILLAYGLLGLLLLPFLHRTPRVIWRWVVGVWAVLLVVVLIGPVRACFLPSRPPVTTADIQAIDAGELEFIGYLASHYLSPSWMAVTEFRISDYPRVLRDSVGGFIVVFANLLTGLALWKSGLLKQPALHVTALKRFVRWALPTGVVLHAIYGSKFIIRHWGWGLPWETRRVFPVVVDFSLFVGALLFSLGIGAAILVLTQDERWGRRLAVLAAPGRTALTTYLTQSIVMTTIFYGWGLGYYNHMRPSAGLVLGLVSYAAQVLISNWWLRHFRFGPVEWLWRCVTYWTPQPFRASSPGEPIGTTEALV
jgi:uncharacterized protein